MDEHFPRHYPPARPSALRTHAPLKRHALCPALLALLISLTPQWVMADAAACAPSNTSPSASARVTLLTTDRIADLVTPYALLPDDLVERLLTAAGRFEQLAAAADWLDDRGAAGRADPDDLAGREPLPCWDDAVVALLNHPELLHRMVARDSATRLLGRAAEAQMPDVLDAIARHRRAARASGQPVDDVVRALAESGEDLQPASAEATLWVLTALLNASPAGDGAAFGFQSPRHPFTGYYAPDAPDNRSDDRIDRRMSQGVARVSGIEWSRQSLGSSLSADPGRPYHRPDAYRQNTTYRWSPSRGQRADRPSLADGGYGRSLYPSSGGFLDRSGGELLNGPLSSAPPTEGDATLAGLATEDFLLLGHRLRQVPQGRAKAAILLAHRNVAPLNRTAALDGGRLVARTRR